MHCAKTKKKKKERKKRLSTVPQVASQPKDWNKKALAGNFGAGAAEAAM